MGTRALDRLNQHGAADMADLCGVWLLPAFLNHSCRPNVNETFVADMLLCRSGRPLARGSELLTSYVSVLQPLHVRRGHLKEDFGFVCKCGRCVLEEAMFSESVAKRLQNRLRQITEKIGSTGLQATAGDFESLKEDVKKEVSKAVSSNSQRLSEDSALKAACAEFWGSSSSASKRERLQVLLCSSFLPVFKGAAFAWKQLGNHSRATSAYGDCLDLLEEVAAGSAYHAHWAAECALQAHAAKLERADIEQRVRYAQRWNVICYGKESFQLLMKRHGWPESLLAMAPAMEATPAEATAEAFAPPARTVANNGCRWDFDLLEGSCSFTVSIGLPTGATPADLDLDVAAKRVVCKYTGCGGDMEPLEIDLPRSVDQAHAPPAKFKKKERRIVLELPFAA